MQMGSERRAAVTPELPFEETVPPPDPTARENAAAWATRLAAPLQALRYRRLLARLPRVEGDWPAARDGRPLILTACDAGYLTRYLGPLAASIDRNAPGTCLHVHVVNPAPGTGDRLAALQRHLARTALSWTRETADLAALPEAARPVYYAGIRFLRATQVLERTGRPLLLLDVDSLVNAPLDPILVLVGDADVGLRQRFHIGKAVARVAVGTLYLGSTLRTLRFLRDVDLRIGRDLLAGRPEWFLDQLAIYRALLIHRCSPLGLRVGAFPVGAADWKFAPSSPIWSAAGDRKTQDNAFTRALEHYTRTAG